MSNELKTQESNPLADSFLFQGCIVLLVDQPSGWATAIKNQIPDYSPYTPASKHPASHRLFYFPGEGLWECFIHFNIACIIPRRIVVKGDSQVKIILEYLVLTIRNIYESPELPNIIGYKVFFYLPSVSHSQSIPTPIEDYETTGNIINKTCLGTDLRGTYKEFKSTLVFDGSWNTSQKKPYVPLTGPQSWSSAGFTTSSFNTNLGVQGPSFGSTFPKSGNNVPSPISFVPSGSAPSFNPFGNIGQPKSSTGTFSQPNSSGGSFGSTPPGGFFSQPISSGGAFGSTPFDGIFGSGNPPPGVKKTPSNQFKLF